MNYAEIKDQVQILTGRDAEAGAGGILEKMIQAATLRMHQSDFYARDLEEDVIDLGATASSFSFANTTFARYRKLHYLRKTDALVNNTAGALLSHLDIKNLFNAYGREKNDVWYEAGANIVVRSSTDLRYLMAGWYQTPVITPIANYASWIAELVPYAIVFDACSLVFQLLEQQEKSRKFDALVQEQLLQVKMHGLAGEGK